MACFKGQKKLSPVCVTLTRSFPPPSPWGIVPTREPIPSRRRGWSEEWTYVTAHVCFCARFC